MIKNNLRQVLLDQNMSLRQLAKKTGLTYTTVQTFASMKRDGVNFDTVEAICRALNVDVGDLLTLSPPVHKTNDSD